jgi:hypothetical protein
LSFCWSILLDPRTCWVASWLLNVYLSD